MHEQARRGRLGAKLAFARISFGYFASEAVFRYVLDAVHLIAERGLEAAAAPTASIPHSGLWEHERGPGRFTYATASETVLADQLEEARRIMLAADPAPATDPPLTPEFERVRWFPLPGEAGAAAALPSLQPR